MFIWSCALKMVPLEEVQKDVTHGIMNGILNSLQPHIYHGYLPDYPLDCNVFGMKGVRCYGSVQYRASMSSNLADKINFLQTWILSISNIRQAVLVQPFLQLDKLQVTEIWSRISTLELVQHHHLTHNVC